MAVMARVSEIISNGKEGGQSYLMMTNGQLG